MVKFSRQFTLATTIVLVNVGAIAVNKAQAASLYLGLSKYVENIHIGNKSNTEELISSSQENLQLSTAEQINQDIDKRYQGLIEENVEQLGLIEGQKLLKDQGLLEQIESLENEQEFVDSSIASVRDMLKEEQEYQIPKSIIYTILVVLGIWAIPTFNYVSKYLVFGEEGLIDNFQNKFGNPPVPEGTVFLHNRAFEELTKIAPQVTRINSEKFGSEEFLLFIRVKQSVEKGIEDYQKLEHRGELLKVAIAAQSSFLRIEQTELRFRSTKQQEFYQFVADSLSQEQDESKFRDKVKRKLAEIIPLVNTEEGRQALQSYLKEIDQISKHKLGLKLLALFKEYQLADFTIIKRVSDIVNQMRGYDLFAAKNLVGLVINEYEAFEKLSPIIGISESENNPETYSKILQYLGLISRHDKSYDKFKQLMNALQKWQNPYKTIEMIRKEYKASEYRLPKEFSEQIPGLSIYKKYEKFIEKS